MPLRANRARNSSGARIAPRRAPSVHAETQPRNAAPRGGRRKSKHGVGRGAAAIAGEAAPQKRGPGRPEKQRRESAPAAMPARKKQVRPLSAYSRGDLVMAKLGNHPYWPAEIRRSFQNDAHQGRWRRSEAAASPAMLFCYFPDDDSGNWVPIEFVREFTPAGARRWQCRKGTYVESQRAAIADAVKVYNSRQTSRGKPLASGSDSDADEDDSDAIADASASTPRRARRGAKVAASRKQKKRDSIVGTDANDSSDNDDQQMADDAAEDTEDESDQEMANDAAQRSEKRKVIASDQEDAVESDSDESESGEDSESDSDSDSDSDSGSNSEKESEVDDADEDEANEGHTARTRKRRKPDMSSPIKEPGEGDTSNQSKRQPTVSKPEEPPVPRKRLKIVDTNKNDSKRTIKRKQVNVGEGKKEKEKPRESSEHSEASEEHETPKPEKREASKQHKASENSNTSKSRNASKSRVLSNRRKSPLPEPQTKLPDKPSTSKATPIHPTFPKGTISKLPTSKSLAPQSIGLKPIAPRPTAFGSSVSQSVSPGIPTVSSPSVPAAPSVIQPPQNVRPPRKARKSRFAPKPPTPSESSPNNATKPSSKTVSSPIPRSVALPALRSSPNTVTPPSTGKWSKSLTSPPVPKLPTIPRSKRAVPSTPGTTHLLPVPQMPSVPKSQSPANSSPAKSPQAKKFSSIAKPLLSPGTGRVFSAPFSMAQSASILSSSGNASVSMPIPVLRSSPISKVPPLPKSLPSLISAPVSAAKLPTLSMPSSSPSRHLVSKSSPATQSVLPLPALPSSEQGASKSSPVKRPLMPSSSGEEAALNSSPAIQEALSVPLSNGQHTSKSLAKKKFERSTISPLMRQPTSPSSPEKRSAISNTSPVNLSASKTTTNEALKQSSVLKLPSVAKLPSLAKSNPIKGAVVTAAALATTKSTHQLPKTLIGLKFHEAPPAEVVPARSSPPLKLPLPPSSQSTLKETTTQSPVPSSQSTPKETAAHSPVLSSQSTPKTATTKSPVPTLQSTLDAVATQLPVSSSQPAPKAAVATILPPMNSLPPKKTTRSPHPSSQPTRKAIVLQSPVSSPQSTPIAVAASKSQLMNSLPVPPRPAQSTVLPTPMDTDTSPAAVMPVLSKRDNQVQASSKLPAQEKMIPDSPPTDTKSGSDTNDSVLKIPRVKSGRSAIRRAADELLITDESASDKAENLRKKCDRGVSRALTGSSQSGDRSGEKRKAAPVESDLLKRARTTIRDDSRKSGSRTPPGSVGSYMDSDRKSTQVEESQSDSATITAQLISGDSAGANSGTTEGSKIQEASGCGQRNERSRVERGYDADVEDEIVGDAQAEVLRLRAALRAKEMELNVKCDELQSKSEMLKKKTLENSKLQIREKELQASLEKRNDQLGKLKAGLTKLKRTLLEKDYQLSEYMESPSKTFVDLPDFPDAAQLQLPDDARNATEPMRAEKLCHELEELRLRFQSFRDKVRSAMSLRARVDDRVRELRNEFDADIQHIKDTEREAVEDEIEITRVLGRLWVAKISAETLSATRAAREVRRVRNCCAEMPQIHELGSKLLNVWKEQTKAAHAQRVAQAQKKRKEMSRRARRNEEDEDDDVEDGDDAIDANSDREADHDGDAEMSDANGNADASATKADADDGSNGVAMSDEDDDGETDKVEKVSRASGRLKRRTLVAGGDVRPVSKSEATKKISASAEE